MTSNRISERGLAVLHAIVSDYVETHEPVGSKAIVERHRFGVSAATIRNDMALLEEEELIIAPHTSSGRIPTDKGYRLYVDTLSRIRPLNSAQRSAIERFLGESTDLDDALGRAVRLLAQLTHQVALVQYPSLTHTRVQHVELIAVGESRVLCVIIFGNGVIEQQVANLPASSVQEAWVHGIRNRLNEEVANLELEDAVNRVQTLQTTISDCAAPGEVAVVAGILQVVLEQLQANRSERITIAGTANLSRPIDFVGNLPTVLEAIEEQVTILRLFGELARDGREVMASIGRENEPYGFSGATVIASSYESESRTPSGVGVLGPIRMDYVSNIATVRAVARYLSGVLRDSSQ